LKKNFLNIVVGLISLLLLVGIMVTFLNNYIIERNRHLQREAETIKIYVEQIGKSTIHGVDIGLRGFAVFREERFFTPADSAYLRKDSILSNIETRLLAQGYPQMAQFTALKDSLEGYFRFCFHLKELLVKREDDRFRELFGADKGLYLWIHYLNVQKNIAAFEDRINAEAQQRYQAALKGNYLLQIVLFLICVPTLLYTAFYTKKTMRYEALLREAETQRNKLLTDQNLVLEKTVAERTQEIVAQNEELQSQSEEISAQRDILASQNKRLQEAQMIIEKQNHEILTKNDVLEVEVSSRTRDLQDANHELIEQNNQLEQFAFIAAHNLRAPLTRIMGLAHVLEISPDPSEKDSILNKLVGSAKDLDAVIKDLNTILDIKKHNSNMAEVNLKTALDLVNKTLEKEFEETSAKLSVNLGVNKVFGVAPYVESTLYNLLSNAIKYRHPDRRPMIDVVSEQDDEFVCVRVSDNGLGIDLNRHKHNMFSLYKRFHLHMEGKGVGLYLVKTQMAALGGRVEVESSPNAGATFRLYFKKCD
jgi:signal transduction histidine kinase